MEEKITIENLQQEVAELKIKIEAKDAEINRLKEDLKNAKDLKKIWEDSSYENTLKCNKLTDRMAILKAMINNIRLLNADISPRVGIQLELIEQTIDVALK